MTKHKILPQTAWSSQHVWRPTKQSFAVLVSALTVFGIGDGLMVLAALGSTPWTVLAQGLALQTAWPLAWTTFGISAWVLLLWLPLRQRPGLGTVLNMTLIALALGATVALLEAPQTLWLKIIYCLTGIFLVGTASAFYLTCYLGAGPRDGLMVGLCSRFGWPVGRVRTGLEAAVCFIGWLMGGTVGIGTLLFAFGVGWVVQWTLLGIRRWAQTPKQQTVR